MDAKISWKLFTWWINFAQVFWNTIFRYLCNWNVLTGRLQFILLEPRDQFPDLSSFGVPVSRKYAVSALLWLVTNPAHLDKFQMKSLYLLLHGPWVKLWDPGRRNNIRNDRKAGWPTSQESLFHFLRGEPPAEWKVRTCPQKRRLSSHPTPLCPTADFSFLVLMCFPNSAGLSMIQIKARCAPSCLGESDLVRGLEKKEIWTHE